MNNVGNKVVFSKDNSLWKVLLYAIIVVFAGEFTVSGSPFLIVVSLLISVVLLTYLLNRKIINYVELIGILIIVASYRKILHGAGGYVTFITALLYLLDYLMKWKLWNRQEKLLLIPFVIFTQVLAYFFYGKDTVSSNLIGLFSLVGLLFSLHFIKIVDWNIRNIFFILKVISSISILNFIVVVITKFDLFNSSLFIFSERFNDEGGSNPYATYGTFGSSELFGEFNLIIYIISSFIIYNKAIFNKKLNLRITIFYFTIFASLVNALLSFSKSVVILLVVSTVTIFVFSIFRQVKLSRANLSMVIIIFLTPFLLFGLNRVLSFDYIFERISKNPEFAINFINNPFSGEGTSREAVFLEARTRIQSESFILGYGWKPSEKNRETWFDKKDAYFADYHNLYYSLIPIFGWINTILFLIIIISIIRKLGLVVFFANKLPYEYILFGNLFLLIIIITLIDQLKITALRSGNYLFLFITILGIAHFYAKQSLQKNNRTRMKKLMNSSKRE